MRMGRISGITVKVHPSALLIAFIVGLYAVQLLIGLTNKINLMDISLVGGITGILMLGSILAHELAHSLVAQKYGLKVREIELFIFGGVSKIEGEPENPKSEILIALVGPLVSLLLGALFLYLNTLIIGNFAISFKITLVYLGISNFSLGMFNIIPAFPLDGGRVLRAILWVRCKNYFSASISAAKIGGYIAKGLMFFGFFEMILFNIGTGFWFILIGLFLNAQAKQVLLQLRAELLLINVDAENLMRKFALSIPFNMTIEDAIKKYFTILNKTYFPVIQGDRVVGIISLRNILKVPREKWKKHIVGYIMDPISRIPSISMQENGFDALKKFMYSENPSNIIVIKDSNNGPILGFIEEEDLLQLLNEYLLNQGHYVASA